jgi:hypothetical protein
MAEHGYRDAYGRSAHDGQRRRVFAGRGEDLAPDQAEGEAIRVAQGDLEAAAGTGDRLDGAGARELGGAVEIGARADGPAAASELLLGGLFGDVDVGCVRASA